MQVNNQLDQLKDIHLPEAVGFWPPALGWWLLAALLIAVIVALYGAYLHYRKRAYRRIAANQINQLFTTYQNDSQPHEFSAAINALLKRTASQSYPKENVSRLSQNEWLAFLDSSANMQAFSHGPGQVLANAPYDTTSKITDAAGLVNCCRQWIRRHQ